MNCDTSRRPLVNVALYGPRAVHVDLLRFIRGVRARRENAVTRAQIGRWMIHTPAELIDAALIELVAEGAITCCALSLRSNANRARRAYGYEVAR